MEAIRRKMHTFANKLLHDRKRQLITAAAAFFIVYVLLMSGIFSYFHSKDSVTNRMNAKGGSVTIYEPSWDSSGQFKAKASEPGMKIEKDPYGYNNGQSDVFIRLKMTIDTSNYTAKNETYAVNFPDDKSKRTAAILSAIKLENGDPLINGTVTNNPDFIMSAVVENEKTVYYFYYTGENSDTMKLVKPQESTKELFNHIDIPVYKKDYFGVFDQPYNITLEAEGVPASNYPNGLTAAEAMTSGSPFNG
ncbi:MAG: hypothetical protein E7495_04155 [Ruminococcus flavefaciens]|nr:hypothetical protein [Ruminococcus flavefaciens]